MVKTPRQIKGITITTHYPKTDQEMWGDYYDVTIHVACGDMLFHMDYGDSYHDKGMEKAEGFVDAIKLLYGDKIPILRLRAADREEY